MQGHAPHSPPPDRQTRCDGVGSRGVAAGVVRCRLPDGAVARRSRNNAQVVASGRDDVLLATRYVL